MGERIQPGGRVDEDVYERFKKFVQRHHGQVRGALGEELEAAMRERMDAVEGTDRLTRIEDDIATIKAHLAETDGGAVHLQRPESHTHTDGAESGADASDDQDDPDIVPDEQPHHRASSRRDRAAWLFGWIRDEIGADGQVHRNVLKTRAKKTWGYDPDGDLVDDLADRAIDILGEHFDAEEHPTNDGMTVWGDRADEVWDEHLADQQDDADDDFDDLEAGHPANRD